MEPFIGQSTGKELNYVFLTRWYNCGEQRVISKSLQPPRSPDLITYEFHLWGNVMGKAYNNNSQTIEDFKMNIFSEIATNTTSIGKGYSKYVKSC